MIRDKLYYFGKDPEYDAYMISHPFDGKQYWCFQTEQEMIDFLDNLPESADPPMIGGNSIWLYHGKIPQDVYNQIFDDHRQYLSRLLQHRRNSGTTFPYENQ